MAPRRTFYITTAIPYANGAPHIGHAYERIATDAIARFRRLDGDDVLFVTGMDEHGQKMQQTAAREGLRPIELADRTARLFAAMGEILNAPADDVIRTTQPRHHLASQEIWKRMAAAGDIYLSKYPGWYSVRDESFFDESELIMGEGGQPVTPSGAPVEWIEEESYFFRLSAYQEKLLAHYRNRPDFVVPETYRNEVIAFVERGLNDLSVSRSSFAWGIPVPGDASHVMYVWVDALTNYITATGFPDPNAPRARFWPADVHVIGKDITRFHAVYWPAFLMSAGIALPKQIVVHGFLFDRGQKMSKSVGNVIDPFAIARHYGVDQVRYFFLREVPFGQDGNYSHEAIVARINADLANDLGNLVQRSLTMIARNCAGRVPDWRHGLITSASRELLSQADSLIGLARTHMVNYALHHYIAAVFGVIAQANRYFASHEPWKLANTDPDEMRIVLYVTIETLRIVGILLQPIMPTAMAKLLDLLAVPAEERDFQAVDMLAAASSADVASSEAGGNIYRFEIAERYLPPNRQLPTPVPIFPRYVETEQGGATPQT
jgi:methionyl-tRNA synthetase